MAAKPSSARRKKTKASRSSRKLGRKYPKKIQLGEESLALRRLTEQDRTGLLDFARALGEDDLMFLRFDITREEVIDRIVADQANDQRFTIVATSTDGIVGYGSLSREPMSWTRHLGEIRVIVGTRYRGAGLGAVLGEEVFEISRLLRLRKVVARMPLRQEGARKLFERLGFAAEALLPDWVVDRGGQTHDLLIMGHDVSSLS